MYKGGYFNELDRIEKRMTEFTYTPFEYLVLRLLILLVRVKLDSVN